MRRLFVSLVILACGGLAMAAAHQERVAPVRKVRGIQNVRDNLYFITGGDTYEVGEGRPTYTGGNVAVFVTDEGVVLVDSMLSGSGPGILEQIKKVTEKPVIMLINTHTHYDHTGSNTELPAAVDFVAHENTKTSLSKATCEPVTNCDSFKGENAKFLPETTFEDKMSLLSGKDQIDLYYFGRGHTDGDAWVVFPAVRAMHAGDMFQRKNMRGELPRCSLREGRTSFARGRLRSANAGRLGIPDHVRERSPNRSSPDRRSRQRTGHV